jgi:outer membrane protein assembly factor BamB
MRHDKGGGQPSVDRDSNVYIGFWGGWLYALTKEGKAKWRLKLDMESAGSTPVIGAKGIIYLGGQDKYLYAIE